MKFEYEPGRFYAEVDDKTVAELIFTIGNNVISINHTFVAPEYRGRGIAGKLMLTVINYAQEHQFKIEPVCSYAQQFFARNDKYADLLLDEN
ncbi:GNAT family N-acetyltransferase [Fructilactobacillus frigidiflavus]|uniref:GNAT family N-acetyltransferase n=1 Tax=Fructilactobacillus frigidiflavus TaxID=3242688 RepID=UPI0037574305